MTDREFKELKSKVLERLRKGAYIITTFYDEAIINDKEVALALVKNYSLALRDLNYKNRDDEEIVRCAMTGSFRAYDYASNRLKRKVSIGEFAMTLYPYIYPHLDPKLRNNKTITSMAVEYNPSDFEYASKKLKKDKKYVIELLEKYKNVQGITLICKFMDDELKKDKEITLVAIQTAFHSLEYFDESVKKDKEVAIAAVNIHGKAINYLDESFKKSKCIVLIALKTYPQLFNHLDNVLQADYDIMKLMLELHPKFTAENSTFMGNYNRYLLEYQIKENLFLKSQIQQLEDRIANIEENVIKDDNKEHSGTSRKRSKLKLK